MAPLGRKAALAFCAKAGFPDEVTVCFLTLINRPDTLKDAAAAWWAWEDEIDLTFEEVVLRITGAYCITCEGCDQVVWSKSLTTVVDRDQSVCLSCLDEYCLCGGCGHYFENTTTIHNDEFCDRCRSRSYSFCETCDEWYHDSNVDAHDHADACACEAPVPVFDFPANGDGTVAQDERITVELPVGTIDESGMQLIRNHLYNRLPWQDVESALDAVGCDWLGQRGNFTRRLSRAIYEQHAVKLAPGILTEVGNLARHYSSENGVWHVEFTRDLNQSAEQFYHDESCWWGSYYKSRCALKNWGGIGMRSYEDLEAVDPNGRAWVQPLNDELSPTHDAVNARAYLVYNCYGVLEGAVGARIIAHLTSRTYGKIPFSAEVVYVNSGGWLVADEETCNATRPTGLRFTLSEHDQLDANSMTREKVTA